MPSRMGLHLLLLVDSRFRGNVGGVAVVMEVKVSAQARDRRITPASPTPGAAKRPSPALVPYGYLRRRAASAGAFTHVGVAEVEVGYYAVASLEAEEAAHVLVVGYGARAPDAREA
jgi:hypothetical protein